MLCKGMEARYLTLRQCARALGFVALVFSLTVASLLATNWMRAGMDESVRSEVLTRALEQSRTQPDQKAAVEFARELDLLARNAYFSSFAFRQRGMLLLLAGLLLTAGAFGFAWRMSLKIPDPRGLAESDPAHTDRLTVTTVIVASSALLVVAAGLEAHHRFSEKRPDAALRAQLVNPALKPGEVNVCPCRKGTTQAELDAQWPFLRGPTLSGRASTTQAPVAWDAITGKGVKWKIEQKHKGFNSPVIWGDKLFIASGDATSRQVTAFNTETGAQLWETMIPDGEKAGAALPEATEDTGLAAPTPACDGQRVYAIFGTGDLVALDHAGKIVWQKYLGRPENTYGHASSLVYCGEILIVQWDQEKHAKILAINKKNGETIWETPRQVGLSWSTPVLLPVCDKPLLIVHASKHTWGIELATGKKLWDVDATSGEVAPSLTYAGNIWLAANCYSRMVAFELSPEGTGAPVQKWQWDEGNITDVSSPVIAEDLAFMVTDGGELTCHDLKDGTVVWHKEYEDGFYASPIVAGGKLYIVDRKKGIFRVLEVGREAKEMATNPMGEPVSATPAFVGSRIYIRGNKHLWCVGE